MGLWHRLPVSIDPPTGPRHRSLEIQAGVGSKNCRDPARSPWITSSPLSPRSAGITYRGPCALVVPMVRAGSPGAPEGQGHRLPRCVAGHHLDRPCTGSLHVQTCDIASAPSAPRVASTHWASATELQRPKLGKDLHLLAGEAARRTRSLAPAQPGPDERTELQDCSVRRTRGAESLLSPCVLAAASPERASPVCAF